MPSRNVPEFPGPEARGRWRAWGGCLDGLRAEAFVPWYDVRECGRIALAKAKRGAGW